MEGTPKAPDFQVGTILDGTVTGLAPFGAFVSIGEGKSGMVHISEVADVYVRDVAEHLKIGDVVKVRVMSMDNNRISLSIKRALPPKAPAPRPTYEYAPRQESTEGFEDRLNKFIKDSEDRLLDARRNRDNRRGGSRR